MFKMDTETTIMIIATLMALITSLSTIIYTLRERNARKEFELNSKIEDIRYNLEKQLYQVNDKLLSTEDRWKDVNHLIISSQNINNTKMNNSETNTFSFFNKAGIDVSKVKMEKDLIFYLTPFHKEKSNAYRSIKKICESMGLRLSRGDEIYLEKKNIFNNILENILKSRMIIANIDGRNPNVFYELGIAHALDKPTIIISNDINKVPFDLQSQYIILYSDDLELESKIGRALMDTIINRE